MAVNGFQNQVSGFFGKLGRRLGGGFSQKKCRPRFERDGIFLNNLCGKALVFWLRPFQNWVGDALIFCLQGQKIKPIGQQVETDGTIESPVGDGLFFIPVDRPTLPGQPDIDGRAVQFSSRNQQKIACRHWPDLRFGDGQRFDSNDGSEQIPIARNKLN